MDSLTQGLLGAVTFAVVKDKEIGKKSLLIGAVAGTIPDLDVFLAPFFHDVEFLSVHRSVSHSIILAIALSILLGAIFHRVYKKRQSQPCWVFAFFLAIMTHSLLDMCTTYGTKLLSPFSSYLFSTNNIHVFEPIYTLILLVGVFILSFRNQPKMTRQKIINMTLIISTLYLSCTFVLKGIAINQFVNELQEQNISYDKLIVSPTPFNSVLWHGIAKTPTGYYFGTYSIFDKREQIQFAYEESSNEIIAKIKDHRLIKYYMEYTQGFHLIKTDQDDNVNIYAIKYGSINFFGPPEFIFPLSFNLKELNDEHIKIDRSGKEKAPVKNYAKLLERIKGI